MSTPIRSSSASGPIGRPQPSFIAASMSSREAYFASYIAAAWLRYPNSSPSATKPGRSPTATGSLPRSSARSVTAATAAGAVSTEETTSTSRIAGAGLKKCRPSTRSGCADSAASRVTESALVPVARIVSGRTTASSSRNTCCLISYDSGTTSITRSASPAAWRSVKVRKRARTSPRRSSVSRPRATERAVAASRAATARVAAASLMSMPTTSRPAWARTSAMPVPMVPRPTTATVRSGDREVSERGVAIAGLQEGG